MQSHSAPKRPPARDGAGSTLPPPFDDKTEEEWIDDWSTVLLSLPIIRAALFLALQRGESGAHHSVPVHVLDLVLSHPLHARFLLDESTRCIPLINQALAVAQRLLHASLLPSLPSPSPLSLKRGDHLHVRPFYLPSTHHRSSINDIRSKDTGSLISVTGSVVRTFDARVYEYAAQFECDRCRGRFYQYADEDAENRIELPSGCRAWLQPEANADNEAYMRQRKPCRSPLIHQTPQSLPRDVQMVRLQENLHRSQFALPRSIVVRLTDDLCETVKTGDVIHVTGMVRRQWGSLALEQRVNVEPYIDAFHVDIVASSAASASAVSSEPPVAASEFQQYWHRADGRGLRARNHIVNCLAPSLVGMFLPKLACLLALIGGVRKEDRGELAEDAHEDSEEKEREKGMHIRGDIHILLVGDAGVGKSVLLSSASLISPRGVLTTGTGTTTAGLTVAAVRSQSRSATSAFTLEPGALVLADGGVCCIDEFNCISKGDRPAVLEAMEQQTISVAKGGVVTTLSTRTSVIAALNPKGKYDHDVDLSVNTALGSPLLSRFDVILVLLDTRNEEWDEKVAQHLLHALPSAHGSGVKKQEALDEASDDEDDIISGHQTQSLTQLSQRIALTLTQATTTASQLLTQPWSVAQMQSYINHVKTRFFPVLSSSCQLLLTRYYQLQRRTGGPKQARINIRLLESLVRLTQAHARLMWRDECLLLDAVMAVMIMEHSALSCGLLAAQRTTVFMWSSAMPTTVSALHVEFSQRPEEEYDRWEATILSRLGLSEEADAQQQRRPSTASTRASAVSASGMTAPRSVSFGAASAAGRAVASIEAASAAKAHAASLRGTQRTESDQPLQSSFPLPTPPPAVRVDEAAPIPPPPLALLRSTPPSSSPPSQTRPSQPPRVPAPLAPMSAARPPSAPSQQQPSPAAAPAQSVLRSSALSSSSPSQSRGDPGASALGRQPLSRTPSVTFAPPLPRSPLDPSTPATDPYTLSSQSASQLRRAPTGNTFRSTEPRQGPPALPPAPLDSASPAKPGAPSQPPHIGRPHPPPPSSRPSGPVPPAPRTPAPPPRPMAPPPPVQRQHPAPAATTAPRPTAPSTPSQLRPPAAPVNAFLTPVRPPPAAASLQSPPPLSAVSATPKSSLASPLSSLSSSGHSSRKENVGLFNAVSLPSSFAAAVKFTNPFAAASAPPPVQQHAAPRSVTDAFSLPEETDGMAMGAQWLESVSEEVVNGLDLGF